MRFGRVLLGTLVIAAILVALVLRERPPHRAEFCSATVGGTRAQVDLEQSRWASLISAQAQNRGLPPRATTIAIATAFQESRLHNIDYGDRDSVGLFQQRPSQGWGTVDEIMDPYYSIGKFYDGLVQVDDYENLEITVAAQTVQRSGFPDAYAQHETRSRVLASALRGFSPATFTCRLNPRGPGNLGAAVADLDQAFGATSADITGTRAEIPLAGDPEDVSARGWAYAHYAVANAARLQISTVSFDGHTWTVEESADGWQASEAPADLVSIATS